MDQPTIDELMDDILDAITPPKREPGEFTADELAGQAELPVESMRSRLKKGVRLGLLEMRKASVDGKVVFVFKKKPSG